MQTKIDLTNPDDKLKGQASIRLAVARAVQAEKEKP